MFDPASNISRRTFIKTFGNGMKVGLAISSFPALSLNDCGTPYAVTPQSWSKSPGVAKQRIEGLPKILGQKIYARDFHAADIKGWPKEEKFVYAVRCDRVNMIYEGLNLDVLPDELQPLIKVDQALITKDKLQLPCDMSKPYFVSPGEYPDYYGQPVALLIFANYRIFRKAKKILQFNSDLVRYELDSEIPLPCVEGIYKPTFKYVRDDSQNFNYVQDYDSFETCDPSKKDHSTRCHDREIVSGPVPGNRYDTDKDTIATQINEQIKNTDNLVVSRDFITQSVDPMFMEPESGMAWYDSDNKKLHLLLGTQSPSGDLERTASIFADKDCPFKLSETDGVELLSCYPGGGFGGRDSSYFPDYLSLAAPYADGPVRWSFSRFEQFQVGLKRHYSQFSEALEVDNSGKIAAMSCDFVLNGGGRENLSPYVSQLAALSSASAYNITKAVAKGKALNTKDLIGGSQRGFGGPQAFIAIETLIDEAAQRLEMSPIELRRVNALNKTGKTITGAPVEQELGIEKILNKLGEHPLWKNRFAQQAQYEEQGLLYGVGVALSNQAYGTSGDGMYGAVEIQADGNIKVRSPYIDMGNGAATSLGLAPSTWLGRNAGDIVMGEACFFDALGLTTDFCDAGKPNYVIKGSGSSSACLGAFYQQHVMEQAGLVLLISSVVPALSAIWNVSVQHDDIGFQDDMVFISGQKPVAWSTVVKKIVEMKLPTISAAHASFVGQFSTADYEFSGGVVNLPLDYVAVGTTTENIAAVTRTNVINPPAKNYRYGRSTYAPSGALMSVTVNPVTGETKVLDSICVLNAGRLISPELVSGQYQGAIAMAIGYVLKEDCPNSPEGPGNGTWNLDKYHLAHMADVPKNQELIPLEPEASETTARGIAESVLCPLPPAILNALAMATGNRFTQFPVTPVKIKEALI